jgi:type III secretion protein J
MHLKRLLPLCSLLLAGCGEQTLYTNLPEKEANNMAAILLINNIRCQKLAGAENTWNITVDSSQFAQSVQVLNEAGYPKDRFTNLNETFKKSGLISSPTEERIRFMNALANELAETLTHISGVVTARVHIVLPENDPYSDQKTPSSASVFISYLPQINLDDCAREIRQLVTNSIEGLSYDKVNLSLFPASNASEQLPFVSYQKPTMRDFLGVQLSVASLGSFCTLLGLWFLFGCAVGSGVLLMVHKKRKSGAAETADPKRSDPSTQNPTDKQHPPSKEVIQKTP